MTIQRASCEPPVYEPDQADEVAVQWLILMQQARTLRLLAHCRTQRGSLR